MLDNYAGSLHNPAQVKDVEKFFLMNALWYLVALSLEDVLKDRKSKPCLCLVVKLKFKLLINN